ncbi:MAG: NHL repeat-containing protein [Limisphaerales bacterium]
MNGSAESRGLSRRAFIKRSVGSAAIIGLAGAGQSLAAGDSRPNRFAYDLDRWRKTDPKLIRYQSTGRFRCPRPEPRRIAAGPDHRLYLAAGSSICVLDGQGVSTAEFALAAPPRCLAVAGDGTLYVGLRDHLEVYDPPGRLRTKWETPGGRPFFTGVAVGEKDVFIADAGTRVVLRYDRSGKLVRRIGEKNPDRNVPGFIVPSPFFDVEIAPDGLLRVNNPGRHRVEAYTFDGDFEFAWGKPSAGISGFCGCCNPISLALLPDGRCVTCEKGLPRVKVYGADGTFESVVAGPESFAENARACAGEDCTHGGLDAAVDADGRICVLDLVAGDVQIMVRKGDSPVSSGTPRISK